MTSRSSFDNDASRRNYGAPYSNKHPIPTVQKYHEHRDEVNEQQKEAVDAQHSDDDDSKTKRAFGAVKSIFKDEDKKTPPGDPYPTSNRYTQQVDRKPGEHDSSIPVEPAAPAGQDHGHQNGDGDQSPKKDEDNGTSNTGKQGQSATEKAAGEIDPKEKRKHMKKNKRDDGGRVVTDPVTHLPITIRDSTEKDLKRSPENEQKAGLETKSATGMSGTSKSSSQLEMEKEDLQEDFEGMQKVFPPPDFDDAKAELERTYKFAFTIAVGLIFVLATAVTSSLFAIHSGIRPNLSPPASWFNNDQDANSKSTMVFSVVIIAIALVIGFALIAGIRGWLNKKVEEIWTDEVWESSRSLEESLNKKKGRLPESTAWMNSLLASVWPLVNPDLFASVVDMLEDVMQASLPKMVRMVSVDDLGQGSEAIRILGVRCLPTGAAGQTVDEKGNLKKEESNDRVAPGQGQEADDADKAKNEDDEAEDDTEDSKKKQQEKEQKEQEQQSIREGMEAEQGDFVNMELAFAYRARSSGKTIKSKAKNAHLYLKFYLPGGIFLPVWVELRGIIGTMRLRLQLTPDPPFFSLCTLTFLGQPRADISCVPLSKHLPNLMNLPLISSFVQSSIDAALAEYVAPKSLTLDLKDMLVGDDFKKDTVSRGVIVVFIKECKGFKEGDGGIGPMKGSSDGYVTCSWAKFGKTIASTRIIEADQHPIWHEWAYMLVTPEELNAGESIRVQLWDSDKYTADDDLGRVEVSLKELMHNPKTTNRMCDREDRLMGQDADEKMPGTISWSVGYYDKKGITEEQLSSQSLDKRIKTKGDLKDLVSKNAERKLREAKEHGESMELDQQKVQDYKSREDALLCASTPASGYPSGILSIQIHNITGLEIEALQKKDTDTGDQEDEAEQSDNLPSSYCTIILNHKKIYKTRTKPKNSKPFFNAGTEHFIRDWRNTEVMVAVRDSREGENDGLLGIVYLPLHKVFEKRSQSMDSYPLAGGMGFGRIRISMVFRSTEMQLPKELLGWGYGTLEVKAPVKSKGDMPQDIQNDRIKLRSNLARAKMQAANGQWNPKHGKSSVFLACRGRYAMPLVIEFRKSSAVRDSTPAFAVFWLKDIPDEEEKTVTMKVWKGGKENLKKATTCADYDGLEDGEHPLAELEVTMKFWRGLSGYHKSYAEKGKNEDVKDVMEVLDTINDEMGEDGEASDDSDSDDSGDEGEESKPKELNGHKNQDSSDTGEHSDEESATRNPIKKAKQKALAILDGHNSSDDGSRGLIAQTRDYKDHHKELHRKHRGVMQWQATRKADWAFDKVKRGKSRVNELFQHEEKGQGIETEI